MTAEFIFRASPNLYFCRMPNDESLLMELHFLPNIRYMTQFLLYPTVILEGCENYVKGSYRNRCYIAAANGPLLLSVPLRKGKNEQQPIREVRIANDTGWQRQHWISLQSAYGNTPFFDHYADELKPFFEETYPFLFDLNKALLQWLLQKLHLESSLSLTSQYEHHPRPPLTDLRNHIHPKKHRRTEDSRFQPAYYPQAFEDRHGFLPNLSILDLIFCMGPEGRNVLEESVIDG